MPITIPILIFSLCFFIGLLLFKILLAVIVGHQIAVHTCLKVDCKKTLDVCFLHSGYFKALIGYDFSTLFAFCKTFSVLKICTLQ